MPAYHDVRHVPEGSKVELFVSPACPYCADAIHHYAAAGVNYVTYDAQNDRTLRQRMLAYTGGDPTVPAIVIDGEYVQSGWGSPPRG